MLITKKLNTWEIVLDGETLYVEKDSERLTHDEMVELAAELHILYQYVRINNCFITYRPSVNLEDADEHTRSNWHVLVAGLHSSLALMPILLLPF
ncbi:hypothetical protein EEL32_15610 [Brevibacillus laterosporus]|uniref:Uncharacterized protein n=1 Tax=Brevibacillus laterosporus TaxID=1465 RepID=A0A502IGQ6_BRELA|nr:hypothetical protein [Brevibacillus laterosporus]QDX92330.1 hypothetical protein EEL30_08215 [Brevibacillus laterosporus]TPG84882.1 hypothetical protein EEL32_15610 [Brevibacillus laterosporus]